MLFENIMLGCTVRIAVTLSRPQCFGRKILCASAQGNMDSAPK